MKKEIAVGLVVTVVGGFLVFWLTQGIQEERRAARENARQEEQARQDRDRREREQRAAAAAAAAAKAEADRLKGRMAPEYNINRNGNDYKDFVAVSFDACLNACVQEATCKAITFTKSSRQCWMKDSVPHRSDDSSYDSAVKVVDAK